MQCALRVQLLPDSLCGAILESQYTPIACTHMKALIIDGVNFQIYSIYGIKCSFVFQITMWSRGMCVLTHRYPNTCKYITILR